MRIQVLMSTMNLKKEDDLPASLLALIKNKVNCSVINQCPNLEAQLQINRSNLNVRSVTEVGLSKSRNQNLLNLKEQIGVISDQDIRFKKKFDQIILNAFIQYKEADIICFQIEDGHGKPYKEYMKTSKWLNQRDIMKVSSVEIAFKADPIRDSGLSFDENFGLGTTLATGEETIFLSDALKKGLKIRYIPQVIVIHPTNPSGRKFHNNHPLIEAKGAMLYRMFGPGSYAISILFAFKKFKMSSETFLNFVTLMFKGISSYKRLINDQ